MIHPDVYKVNLASIEAKFEIEKKTLAKEFAFANNPYKVGDIITDHNVTIKIDTIKWYMGRHWDNELPYCIYQGVALKKNGTPNKKGTIDNIYQNNIVK